MKAYSIITLNEFIIRRQADFPYAKGELSHLLSHLGVAAKIINKRINKAGLIDILGAFENNKIGKELNNLDEFSEKQFVNSLKASGECCGVLSGTGPRIITFDDKTANQGKYIVNIFPLDGSSNVDVNVSSGSIFSIYRRRSARGNKATTEDFLQEGRNQIVAGYIIYGSSTMLVFTSGRGVNGFTLDPSIGEFCLSHPDIRTPVSGKIYSINQGNYLEFPTGIKKYIKYCQEIDKPTKRPYSSRYIGSLVSDFHRNILKGGIFIYPPSAKYPKGKLFLQNECNPMAFITEQTGAKAINGEDRILEIKPSEIGQTVPLYIGSRRMVDKLEEFLQEKD
ncbi:class 1 fructose-bisphosphatase [Bacteroidota bacterium]